MKPNLLSNRVGVRVISLGLIAASITGAGIILAQQPAPVAPAPAAAPPADSAPPPVEPPRRTVQPPAPIAPSPIMPAPPTTSKPPPQPVPVPSDSPFGRGGNRYHDARTLTRGMLDEQMILDPQTAAKKYEEMVSDFDQQRETAAQAILRLGESYRRMKRFDEARAMYARILREFVDFPDLAKISQRLLTENAPTQPRGSIDVTATPSNPMEEDLIRQELALLEKQLEENEALIKTGQASSSSGFSLQREILQLKQRLARARTDWPTRTPAELPTPKASTSQSRTGRAAGSLSDLDHLQMEVRDLKTQLSLLSKHQQPDTISTQIINDPRFAELKANYELKLLDGSDDEASKKALAGARDRLLKWIHQIYLPELENTLAIKTARLEELEKRAEPRTR